MANVRKRHTAEFKTQVAMEAIRQRKTTNEAIAEYGIHATQVNTWKKQTPTAITETFSSKKGNEQPNLKAEIDQPHLRMRNRLPS